MNVEVLLWRHVAASWWRKVCGETLYATPGLHTSWHTHLLTHTKSWLLWKWQYLHSSLIRCFLFPTARHDRGWWQTSCHFVIQILTVYTANRRDPAETNEGQHNGQVGGATTPYGEVRHTKWAICSLTRYTCKLTNHFEEQTLTALLGEVELWDEQEKNHAIAHILSYFGRKGISNDTLT